MKAAGRSAGAGLFCCAGLLRLWEKPPRRGRIAKEFGVLRRKASWSTAATWKTA